MKKGVYLVVTVLTFLSFLALQGGTIAEAVTLRVLNPRSEVEPPKNLGIAGRVTDLAGKKIGLYWLGKPDGDVFFARVQKLLEEKFPTAKVMQFSGAFDIGDGLAAKIAKEVDTFVYGVGD